MTNLLHSIVLELAAKNEASISATMGHQAHALFLDLVAQADPALAARLHDEPNFRPFTISPLSGGRAQGEAISLRPGQPCRLRFTLLDGGRIYQTLSMHFLQAGTMTLRLGAAEFNLLRMLATPTADQTGWAGYSDWQSLTNTAPRRSLSLHCASPTAFSMGDKQFVLFPEPKLVVESLTRVWNNYAPPALLLDKELLGQFAEKHVVVADYELRTATLHYPKYTQKGFVGTCAYLVRGEDECASRLAMLAEFARFAGVGYKTTMGMGQVRCLAREQS